MLSKYTQKQGWWDMKAQLRDTNPHSWSQMILSCQKAKKTEARYI